jgi:hypothetical protein
MYYLKNILFINLFLLIIFLNKNLNTNTEPQDSVFVDSRSTIEEAESDIYFLTAEIENIIKKSDLEKRQIKICMNNQRLKENVFVGHKNCTRLALTYSFKSSEINAINDDCSKVEINKNSLNYYKTVKKIGIRSNKTKIIDDLIFTNLNNLTEIILTNNEIPNISVNTFNGLLQLKFLSLTENKIKNIHKNAFNTLENIIQIKLNQNLIENIHPDLFRGLKKLKNIQLHDNKLNLEGKISLYLESSVVTVTLAKRSMLSYKKDIFYINNTV